MPGKGWKDSASMSGRASSAIATRMTTVDSGVAVERSSGMKYQVQEPRGWASSAGSLRVPSPIGAQTGVVPLSRAPIARVPSAGCVGTRRPPPALQCEDLAATGCRDTDTDRTRARPRSRRTRPVVPADLLTVPRPPALLNGARITSEEGFGGAWLTLAQPHIGGVV